MKKILSAALLIFCSNFLHLSAQTVWMISTGKVIHRFFDTSPISPSGKYIALFRFPYDDHAPKAGDSGEVILIDLKTGKEKVVATSSGWEMQLGANVQWGNTDQQLFFNDVDTIAWKGFAVCLNPFNGKARRMEGTVFMVSPDGKKPGSYNLEKSIYAQVGYGVIIPKAQNSRNVGPVENDGIYITDVASGKCSQLVSVKDIYLKTIPSITIKDPENYEYYCFQVKWNPQGTRLLTTVQSSPKGGGDRKRTVITMKADGSDIHTAITAEQWAKGGHHINWMPDGEHLRMNLDVDNKKGLEIISLKYDGTDRKTVYSPGTGHPSYHPKGLPYIITDAYAGEMNTNDGKSPIRLIDFRTKNEQAVATPFLPVITNFEFRIDGHPARDKTGTYVVYNGSFQNTRSVLVVDLKKPA